MSSAVSASSSTPERLQRIVAHYQETIGWHFKRQIKLPSEPLYHYTNKETAKQIARSGELWAFNIHRQRDELEVRHGLNEACRLLNDVCETAPRFSYTRQFGANFTKMLLGYEQIVHAHIVCLSLDGNNSSMWREFGDNGRGARLEFHPDFAGHFHRTPENEDKEFSNGACTPLPVIYSVDEFRERLNPLIDSTIEALKDGLPHCNGDVELVSWLMKELSMQLAMPVLSETHVFKREKFQYEQEIRFLQLVRHDKDPRGRKDRNGRSYVPFCFSTDKRNFLTDLKSGPNRRFVIGIPNLQLSLELNRDLGAIQGRLR